MLSWHSHIAGWPGNRSRSWRLICCGLHRWARNSATSRRNSPLASIRRRWLQARRGRVAVSLERPVATGCGVAAQLTRDRRRCPAQLISDLPDAQPRVPQISDLDPLVLRQEPVADLADSQPLQRGHEPRHPAMAVGLVAARPVVPRRPRNPGLAGRGEDAPPPLAQLHEPLALGRLRTPPRPLLHPTRRQHNPQ